MCESCEGAGLRRRDFLAVSSAMCASAVLPGLMTGQAAAAEVAMPPLLKKPARVMAAFLYPPADVVNAGRMEDLWAPHQWFTWPGNQFQPEAQQEKFTARIRKMAQALGVEVEFAPAAIYQRAKVKEFIAQAKHAALDAVLIVNFWNTLSQSAFQMATESAPTAIVYHSLGSNHQLPPESLRRTDGLYYIHSMENFDAEGLRTHVSTETGRKCVGRHKAAGILRLPATLPVPAGRSFRTSKSARRAVSTKGAGFMVITCWMARAATLSPSQFQICSWTPPWPRSPLWAVRHSTL
jgi:hypothetical protein